MSVGLPTKLLPTQRADEARDAGMARQNAALAGPAPAVLVEGLEKGQAFPADGNGTMMRAFMGRDIMPGQKITLTMTGLPEAVAPEGFWSTPKIVGIVGGAVLLVICVIFLVAKPGRKSGQAEAQA